MDDPNFAAIAQRHHAYLLRLASSVLRNPSDAEDAVQNALLCAYLNWEKFQARCAVRTWLHKITLNACLDLIRKRTTSRFDQMHTLEDHPNLCGEDPEREAIFRDLAGLAVEVVPVFRSLIEADTLQEYARDHGLNYNTAKIHMYRGRAKFSKAAGL